MEFFFDPAAIAVVGASNRKTGANLLENLIRSYRGDIYPVNPGYDQLMGLPCFPSVADLPGPVDLAIVLVPAPAVPAVVEACAAKGVRGMMIESAGFAETGPAGAALQARCLEAARSGGVRLWGPNCMGLVDVPRERFFTFMDRRITDRANLAGRVSLVVQSGMLSAGFLLDIMSRGATGVAKVCSVGNRMDVDECDLLEYLLADPDTAAVGLYLESLKRGRRLVELAASAGKPVVAVLGGQSASGARAAMSHTASLAGDARLSRSLLEGAGVALARDFHHMMELTASLSYLERVPPRARVLVITFSGGAGILTCDILERHGLRLAELSPATLERLATEVFPEWMAPGNPVDLYPAQERIGRLEAFSRTADICLGDPGVDVIICHYLAGLDPEPLDAALMKGLADRAGKGLAFWCLGRSEAVREFCMRAQAVGAPAGSNLSSVVEGLALAARRQERLVGGQAAPQAAPQAAAGAAGDAWDERRSKELLAAYGVPVVAEEEAEGVEEAAAAAARLGWPVVLKGLAPGLVHKSELGLVRTGLADAEALRRVCREMAPALGPEGRFLVQRQASADFELMAGLIREPGLGPCVMLGRGGVTAELEPDVAFATAPLGPGDALALMDRLRCRPLLDGWRGRPPADRAALAGLLVALGRLALERPEVVQVDLNPVVMERGRPVVVDASVIMQHGEASGK